MISHSIDIVVSCGGPPPHTLLPLFWLAVSNQMLLLAPSREITRDVGRIPGEGRALGREKADQKCDVLEYKVATTSMGCQTPQSAKRQKSYCKDAKIEAIKISWVKLIFSEYRRYRNNPSHSFMTFCTVQTQTKQIEAIQFHSCPSVHTVTRITSCSIKDKTQSWHQ